MKPLFLFATLLATGLQVSSACADLLPFQGNSSKGKLGVTATWPGAGDGIASFRRMKYGFFAHYTWGGGIATDGTHNRDGSFPSGLNDVADRFDVSGFANDLESMGVEYVIFTAWHSDMNCLWPSAKMDQWLTGHTAARDLLGELLTAVKGKGIRVLFYTHPRDGHDMSPADQVATGWNGTAGDQPDYSVFDRTKWNNFINDIYGDLIDRYGGQIDGLFIDEGSAAGDSWRVVDYPRLRQTIKSRQPDLLMVQNFYGTNYSCDIGATEVAYWGSWVPGSDPDNWPATGRPMSMLMGGAWAATVPEGTIATRYDATAMFRLTVLRAGIDSTDGGGVNWAAGPYPGGGWEGGVLAEMQQIGDWIAPIRRSICNTYPSESWVTAPDSTINDLAVGIVGTRSADDGSEFIHVLRAPAGFSITVPPPADGRGYASASLLTSGHPVSLTRQGDGSLTFTLQGTDTWDPRDTVIELLPVTVAWTGNDGSNGPDTGAWNETAENFSGGVPVATRFRSGDKVTFAGGGASNVIFDFATGSVGDLLFAGKNYRIYSQGLAAMTLSSGWIDVADTITATFDQSGMGGSLSLAGTSGLTKSGAGTLVLNVQTTYGGNTVLAEGVIAFAGELGAGGNIVFEGGALRYLPGNRADISSRIRHSMGLIQIDTNGNDVTFATALSVTNVGGLVKLGAGALSLGGGVHSSGDSIVVVDGSLRLDPGTSGTAAIPNAGFESPVYGVYGWSYDPLGTGWTFISASGTASNGSPWINIAPEGVQGAFLQNDGSMSTTLNVPVTGDYVLSFKAANRPNFPPTGLEVMVDGAVIVDLSPGKIGFGGDFNRFSSAAMHLAAGNHTLAFEGIQNGIDSGTIIDDLSLTGVARGTLRATTRLQLVGPTAIFDAGSGVTIASLAGVSGSRVVLTGADLIIDGNDPLATFAGSITGTGSVINNGTLRLVGDGTLDFTGTFTNQGLLDIMTWSGSLPAGFSNDGIVLDRRLVRIASFTRSSTEFSLTISGFSGHTYQLQRKDALGSEWQDIGAPVAGNNASIAFTDPSATGFSRMFYRILLNP